MDYMEGLFDELTRKMGGIYKINNGLVDGQTKAIPNSLLGLAHFRENLNRMAASQESDQQKTWPGIDKISTYFVDNASINALAIRHKSTGYEFIGITTGTSSIIQNYFGLLMSTRDFLPKMGSSGDEPLLFDEVIDDLKHLKGKHFGNFFPKCEIRKKYAYALWACSLDFLCFHEVGHHVRAHLLLLKKLYGVGSISECMNLHSALSKDFYKNSQLLELDADRYSVIVGNISANNLHSILAIDEEVFTSDELLFISTSFLFLIFDELSVDNSLSKSTTHPHPAIRRLNLLYTLGEINGHSKQSEFDKFLDDKLPLVDSLEHIFTLLSKYPKYRKRIRSTEVAKRLVSMRRSLNDLIDQELNELIEERTTSFLKA